LQFGIDYDEMIRYCEDMSNWGFIDEELSRRGVNDFFFLLFYSTRIYETFLVQNSYSSSRLI